jgi:hypothetical protein
LTEESVVVICPNPKCGKEIREPMLLTILCVTPPEQYEACPHCFAKLQPEEYPEEPELDAQQEHEADLDEEPESEELEADDLSEAEDFETEEDYQEEKLEDILPEDDSFEERPESSLSFLDRVKSLIPSSNGSKKEKAEEAETVSIVEPEDVSNEDEDEAVDDHYDEAEDEMETEELEADDEAESLEREEDDDEEDFEDEEEEDEPEEEDFEEEEEPEEEPKAKEVGKTETKQGCPEEFGYLANRDKDVPIPAACYMCPRMVDCMLSPRDD